VDHAGRGGRRHRLVDENKLANVSHRRIAVLLLALFVLVPSSSLWAWTLEGHRLIALDALSALPPQMREALTPHLSPLLAGVEEPDFFRVVSHKIPLISLRGTPPPPRSGAPDALKQFATNAQEMLRLGRDLWDVLFVVGQATHFVQDLNQPLHAGWGETRAEHNEIEAKMLYRSWQKEHTNRGFTLVRDYSCFAYQIAQTSSQHTRTLFFDRDIKRVTELAWDQAVNDTANLWQSILWNTFGPVRAAQMYGILAPVELQVACLSTGLRTE
jgi:hypothetical protein